MLLNRLVCLVEMSVFKSLECIYRELDSNFSEDLICELSTSSPKKVLGSEGRVRTKTLVRLHLESVGGK